MTEVDAPGGEGGGGGVRSEKVDGNHSKIFDLYSSEIIGFYFKGTLMQI